MSRFLVKLKDGRVLATGKTTTVLPSAGNVAITITVPDLKYIEYVVQYRRTTNPTTDPGTPVNEKIDGNVVGLTVLGVGAGTTLTYEAMVVGL